MSIQISIIGETLTQWDVNRNIQVTGAAGSWKAHYYTDCLDLALVVPPDGDGTVHIPNVLLQHPGAITVAIYQQDPGEDAEGRTIYISQLRVAPKLKPQDYDYTENIGYIDWVRKAAEVQAIMDELQRRAESGEFDGKDGYSPTVQVEIIAGGHRITITDKDGAHAFDVLDGKDGGGGVDLDPALTREDAAAQAKAAGDGIRSVAKLAAEANAVASQAMETASEKQDKLSDGQLGKIDSAATTDYVDTAIANAINGLHALADEILEGM